MEFHHLLKTIPGGMPKHGKTRSVKVEIDGLPMCLIIIGSNKEEDLYKLLPEFWEEIN